MTSTLNPTDREHSKDRISDRDLIYEAKISGKIPELFRGIRRRQTIELHARQANIEIAIPELQAAADRFRMTNNLASAEATQQWLTERQLSIDDFEYLITQDVLTRKLAIHLFGDRVDPHFHQNFLDYSSAIIYEVIFEDYNLAMEIFYSLQEGDLSFADVADRYIPTPELRRQGGYIGKVGRKQLRPEISAAIFATNPPQILQPIVTAVGAHLIRVEEIIDPKLDDRLYEKILMEMFDRWLNEAILN